MKNIKCFKHINTKDFECCLDGYGYTIDNVVGFGLYDKKQYRGNILKTYIIYLSDDEHIYFKVVCFKDFNEYRQSALGFNGNKLLDGYQDSNVIKYRYNNGYVVAKCRS